MKQYSEKIIIKTTTIIASFFGLLVLIMLAETPPSRGYELSIYDMYPWYFWYFFIISISCGIIILMHQAFTKQKTNWWLVGLCIIIVSNIIFLGLPFFRGYTFYPSGDALTHLGWMKYTLITGHIEKDNLYPIVHLLGVSLLNITQLNQGMLEILLYIVYYVIYISNIYLLSTVVANHKGQTLLILAFASPLVFSSLQTVLHPSMFSLFMVPLILYLYQKINHPSNKIENRILIILLVFLITYSHPMTTIFLMFLIIGFNISIIIYKQISNRKPLALRDTININTNYNILLILLIIFFTWYLTYSYIQGNILRVYEFLMYQSEVSLFVDQTNQLENANISIYQIIKLFIYRYGAIAIYLIISIFSLIIVSKWSLSKRLKLEPIYLIYTILFFIAILMSTFSLFAFTGEYDLIRISRFFILTAPILNGLVIYKFINNNKSSPRVLNSREFKYKRLFLIFLTFILIVTALIICIFNVYGSSRITVGNWQVSRFTLTGTEWFIKSSDKTIITATDGVDIKRFEDLELGRGFSNTNLVKLDREPIPSHFGYNRNLSISETFNFKNRYLLTSKMGRIAINLLPESARSKAHNYTKDDYNELMLDPEIAQIYNNGEFEVWRVFGG